MIFDAYMIWWVVISKREGKSRLWRTGVREGWRERNTKKEGWRGRGGERGGSNVSVVCGDLYEYLKQDEAART